MNRHPFRWGSLAFGMLFLAGVGHWAVRHEELLSSRQLSLASAGALIVLGLTGVAATLRRSRPTQAPTPRPDEEGGPHDQTPHPLA